MGAVSVKDVRSTTAPSLWHLVRTASYIGAIGYGGPAILALMKQTYVRDKRWISEQEFMNALSLAQILPGATGVTVTGYLGFKLKKIWGGLLAALGFVTPAATLMTILAWAYFRFGQLPFVKSLFAGLGALVVALLVNAVIVLGRSVFPTLGLQGWKGLTIASAGFAAVYFGHINVVWVILGAGLLGFGVYYFAKSEPPSGARAKADARGAVLVRPRLSVHDLVPAGILALALAAALVVPSTRALVASFLGIGTTAFGGGFGSIPLIQGLVVDAHGWLTVKEFLDGIALGQITPGPVFITATFIGYRVAGVAGALLATLAIFTPSLVAIMVLADLHGRVQNLRSVRSVISGLQAGFIGLILSVAVNFAVKSLTDWQEWLIFVAAIGWVMLLKKGAIWAILATIVFSFIAIR